MRSLGKALIALCVCSLRILAGYSIFAVVPAPELDQITGLPSCPAADLALSLPPPRGGNGYSNGSTSSSFTGNGHTLGGPSASRQAFGSSASSSAFKPPLTSTASGSSSRKGKRPASDEDDDDDDIIIEEFRASGSASGRSSVEEESEKRRRRRKIDGLNDAANGAGPGGDGMDAMSEEEMMAAAIRESLRVSGQGSDGSGESSQVRSRGLLAGNSASAGSFLVPCDLERAHTRSRTQARKNRGDVDEEAEFQRALQASLAETGGGAGGEGNATESEASGDEGAEDSPSIDELRRLRLARFGA